jgi:competence protein ComEC
LYADALDIKIGSEIKKDIWYYSSKLRARIIHNRKNNFHKTELNVAVALIMGQQQDIDPDIIRLPICWCRTYFIRVRITYWLYFNFATFILKPIPNTKRGSFIKLLIILCCLFSFGILAGLAPSVVRSVTMFSFVAIEIIYVVAIIFTIL